MADTVAEGQLYEYECWYCHNVVGGVHNIPPRSPCPHCGIYWGAEYGPKAIQVGFPGAHTPTGAAVLHSLENLLTVIQKVFEGLEEDDATKT